MDLSQANRLAEMALDMNEQPDLEQTLDRVVSNARDSISCDAVGVLLARDGGKLVTATATHELVRRADELQLECGEGPCLYTSQTADTWLIDNAARDERLPSWGPRVAALGWSAVLSVRLFTPIRTLGALNLYAHAPNAFDADDVELGQLFGRHASIALMAAQYADSLRTAVSSRHVIGQAQGILMERYQVDADRAFSVLRRYSQDKNVKLRVVAEHVIANHRLPE